MVPQLLVAISAAFAVAIPLTFWLLKKVRIKSKIRHFQVSLALGFPTALFVFLLQTSFAVPVVVITVAFSLLVVALELTLRRVVASEPSTGARTFGMHRTGASVPLDEARNASGFYPYDYFTEDFSTELHQFAQSRLNQLDTYIQHNGQVPSQKSYLAFKNTSFEGKFCSMINGIRQTTDSPSLLQVKQNIYLFGGSTMFCVEVPDRLTISSFLQRLITPLSTSIQVTNCGMTGATAVDRYRMLTEVVKIRRGDVAVFYFGDNDSGWIDHRSGKLANQLVPLPIRALRGMSDFGLEAARWLHGTLANKFYLKFSRLAVMDTIAALHCAHKYCTSQGAQLIAILQPNIYTLHTKSEYEKILEKRFSQDLKTLILQSYKQYEEWVKTVNYGVNATHIFNYAPSSVFLDWSHANARGSELIAKFIHNELIDRKLISDSKEV